MGFIEKNNVNGAQLNIDDANIARDEKRTETQMLKEEKRKERIRGVIAKVNSSPMLQQAWQSKKEKTELNFAYPYPDHLEVEQIEMENFRMEFLTWKDSKSKLAILQLHGGGYMSPMQDQYRKMAGLYSEISGGASVLTINYRVAPEWPFPAALMDALSAFDWLLEKGYDEGHIVVAGDSAGGGLGMALCHKLKQLDRKLPLGLIAMSPWTDLTASGTSYTENVEIDPVFGHDAGGALLHNNPYIGSEDPKNPLISPMFGDFRGFPPMLIQVGTHEMLYDDSVTVAQKAKEAGVSVRFTVYEGMFHVFQMSGPVLPDSKKAWEEAGAFIRVIQGKLMC